MPMRRYIHARDRGMLLLQTSGARLDKGIPQNDLRTGAAAVFGPLNLNNADDKGICGMALGSTDATANLGHSGAPCTPLVGRRPQQNRCRDAVNGCIGWCRTWDASEWNTARGRKVKNRDLWEEHLDDRVYPPLGKLS